MKKIIVAMIAVFALSVVALADEAAKPAETAAPAKKPEEIAAINELNN